MFLFLTILIVTILVLGTIAYLNDQSHDQDDGRTKAPLTLLPGDIKYESPGGKSEFYFPITTSLVLSIVLTLVLRLFS